MECLGHNWRVPRKTDNRGWRQVLDVIAVKRGQFVGYGPKDCPTHSSGSLYPRCQKSNGEVLLAQIERRR